MVEEIGMVGKRETSSTFDAIDGCTSCSARSAHQSSPSGTSDLSLPVAGHGNPSARRSMVLRYHLYPDAARIPVPGSDYGLVQPIHPGVGTVELAGNCFLSDRSGEIAGSGHTRYLQHRSRGTVYQYRVFQPAGGCRGTNKHGRTGPGIGQYIHRAIVAQLEVRGGLHSRLRRWERRPSGTEEIFPVLQHGPAASGVGISDTGRGLSELYGMKIRRYRTMGRTEIARYTRSWKVVFLGLVHQMAEIEIYARKQRKSGFASLVSGKINRTIRRFYVQRSLAYFSAGAVQ